MAKQLPPPRKLIRALTGLRAMAALGVVLFHLSKDAHVSAGLFAPLIWHGYLGVDLFFILSGFIIHHVYRAVFAGRLGKDRYLDFIRNRLARIYPVHLFTMAIMLAFFAATVFILHRPPADASSFTPAAIISSLFLMQGWFNLPSPNIPAWTVSAEWFAYLFYPPLCLGLTRAPRLLRLVLIILCLTVTELIGSRDPLLRICPEFMLGMLCYDLSFTGFNAGRFKNFIGIGLAALLLISDYVFVDEHLGLDAGLFALLIMALTNERDWLGRLLATTPIVYGGEISYSIYMMHGPMMALAGKAAQALHLDFAAPPVLIATLLLILSASALTYHLIELPARRILRGTRRKIVEAPAAPFQP